MIEMLSLQLFGRLYTIFPRRLGFDGTLPTRSFRKGIVNSCRLGPSSLSGLHARSSWLGFGKCGRFLRSLLFDGGLGCWRRSCLVRCRLRRCWLRRCYIRFIFLGACWLRWGFLKEFAFSLYWWSGNLGIGFLSGCVFFHSLRRYGICFRFRGRLILCRHLWLLGYGC